MRKRKRYNVNIDMVWSTDIMVYAESELEAKRKAWDKFKKKPSKKLFRLRPEIDTD